MWSDYERRRLQKLKSAERWSVLISLRQLTSGDYYGTLNCWRLVKCESQCGRINRPVEAGSPKVPRRMASLATTRADYSRQSYRCFESLQGVVRATALYSAPMHGSIGSSVCAEVLPRTSKRYYSVAGVRPRLSGSCLRGPAGQCLPTTCAPLLSISLDHGTLGQSMPRVQNFLVNQSGPGTLRGFRS